MASSRENGLSKPHASMLHAFCACNYIRLPLSRQHKTSVFASRFTPLRHFQYKIGYNAFALDCFKVDIKKGTFLKNIPFSKQKFSAAPYKVQYICLLMMEQADSVETHYHSIFICCFDYLIVTNRSAWLCNNCYTRFSCTFDVVSEREECI